MILTSSTFVSMLSDSVNKEMRALPKKSELRKKLRQSSKQSTDTLYSMATLRRLATQAWRLLESSVGVVNTHMLVS